MDGASSSEAGSARLDYFYAWHLIGDDAVLDRYVPSRLSRDRARSAHHLGARFIFRFDLFRRLRSRSAFLRPLAGPLWPQAAALLRNDSLSLGHDRMHDGDLHRSALGPAFSAGAGRLRLFGGRDGDGARLF